MNREKKSREEAHKDTMKQEAEKGKEGMRCELQIVISHQIQTLFH